MSLAPLFAEVDPNDPSFREALGEAGAILAGTKLNVYSAHRHAEVPLGRGEVIFEELVGPRELGLYPLDEVVAAMHGLPSCWRFDDHTGEVVTLRYADFRLHAYNDLDGRTSDFRVRLGEVGRRFVDAGIHNTLELNIAGLLFPAPEGYVTNETTPKPRVQKVEIVPMPPRMLAGDWGGAACWRFEPDGTPVVTGMCSSWNAADGRGHQ